MLRTFLASLFTLASHVALAHPGHIEGVANHAHYVEYAVLMVIAGAIVCGALKLKRSSHV